MGIGGVDLGDHIFIDCRNGRGSSNGINQRGKFRPKGGVAQNIFPGLRRWFGRIAALARILDVEGVQPLVQLEDFRLHFFPHFGLDRVDNIGEPRWWCILVELLHFVVGAVVHL